MVTPDCITFLLQGCLLQCPPSLEQQHPPRASHTQQWWGMMAECWWVYAVRCWVLSCQTGEICYLELGGRLVCTTSSENCFSILTAWRVQFDWWGLHFSPSMPPIYLAWYADNEWGVLITSKPDMGWSYATICRWIDCLLLVAMSTMQFGMGHFPRCLVFGMEHRLVNVSFAVLLGMFHVQLISLYCATFNAHCAMHITWRSGVPRYCDSKP